MLEAASQALAGIVSTLRRVAAAEDARAMIRDPQPEITAALVRSIIDARRLRHEFLELEIGDSVWALLLEAYACRLSGRRLTITQLVETSEIAPAMTYRSIESLMSCGLLARRADPHRGSTDLIDLTDEAADCLRKYLVSALRLSPWIP